MSIALNFINKSNDLNNSQIVIFQKDISPELNDDAIAWKVIDGCGQGESHSFEFANAITIAATDGYGNHSAQVPTHEGETYSVTDGGHGGIHITPTGKAPNSAVIALTNKSPKLAVDAHIYRGGKLLAVTHGLAAGGTCAFQFKPSIWIGIASQLQQGQVLNAAILSTINTELPLLNVASADIMMTGGGSGPSAKPFQFALANVVNG